MNWLGYLKSKETHDSCLSEVIEQIRFFSKSHLDCLLAHLLQGLFYSLIDAKLAVQVHVQSSSQ